uniref:Uncharacterized protein n=1 Tax=Arundo donax TaxID=35708 RepID=A0A0A8ZC12_ARUDO
MNAWSSPESCKWNSCCSCRSMAASRAPGRCGDAADSPLPAPRWCCFFMSSLTRRWRRPEMKKMTARITMMNNTAGLILPLPPPLPPGVCTCGGDWVFSGSESLMTPCSLGEEDG